MESASVATEPVKKRGRPKKVVEEGPVGEGGKSVRKASTKAAAAAAVASSKAAGKKEEGPKKKAVKSATTKVTRSTKTTAASAKAKPVVEEKAKAGVQEKVAPAPQAVKKTTPVTPSPSRILEEVYAKGTLKKPVAERIESATAPSISPAHPTPSPPSPSSQTQAQIKPIEPTLPASKPIPSAAKPTPPIKPAPTPSSPPPSPPTSAPRPAAVDAQSQPSPTPQARSTTIPLPRNPRSPFNISQPAPQRPRPLSPEQLQHLENERYIREGKMPPKYKPAARRVTAIMVGIPIIVVVGYELYKRYDREIRTKFHVESAKPAS